MKIMLQFVCSALNSLNGYRNGPAAHLISVFFGYSEPGMLSQQSKCPLRPLRRFYKVNVAQTMK